MNNKKNKLPEVKSLIKVKAPLGIVGLKNNSNFCGAIFNQNRITSVVDDNYSPFEERSDLIYNLSAASGYGQEALARIIELLLQLRAAQNDQNVFVQNNTVVKEQILSQLKNEILRVNNRLTKNQVKNLEVVSSNSFDKEVLDSLLKSLLEDAKKKLESNESPVTYSGRFIRILNDSVINKINRISSNFISSEKYKKNLVNRIYRETSFEDKFIKDKIIHLEPTFKKAKFIVDAAQKDIKAKKSAKEKIKIQKHQVQPETENIYEKNVLKVFKEVLPIIKNNKKIVHTSFLENLIRFVKNKEEKPVVLTTVDGIKKINKIKNIYENESVILPTRNREIYTELIDRKDLSEQSLEKEIETTEKIDFVKYKYLLEKDLVNQVNENNVLLKEFKTKINRYQNIIKHTRFENKYITDEDIKTGKIFETGQIRHKNLIHKIETQLKSYDENVTYENIVNDIFKNKFQKDVVKTQKEIKRNINVLKEKDIKEKLKFISEKGTKKIIYQEEKPRFIHSTQFADLKDKALNIENIVKNIPIYQKKEETVKKTFENIIKRNIKRILSPKTIIKSSVVTDKKDIYKNIFTGNVNKYIDRKEFTHKNIFTNLQQVEKEIPLYTPAPSDDYMIYKEELIPGRKTAEESKTSETPSKVIDKFEKNINLKAEKPQINEIDEKQIERNIMAKTLKKSEVKKMIQDYMSGVNVDSISRRVIERVEDKLVMERQRNGIF